MIGKLINLFYNGAIPDNLGDRYYSQDMIRDFQYFRDRIGLASSDICGTIPYIMSGGVVTKGAGNTLDITACIGYAKYSVEIPDTFAAFPPSKFSKDIEAIRIESTAQTNMAIPSAVLDNVTTNYVKLRYKETAGNTRNRARAVGSYNYEYIPDFEFIVDDVAPTDYDVVLAEFISVAGAVPATMDYSNRSYEIELNKIIKTLASTVSYPIVFNDYYENYEANTTGGDVTYTLPSLSLYYGRKIRIIHNVIGGTNKVVINRAGSDTITKDGLTSIYLPKQGDYVELLASQQAGCWIIVSENISCQMIFNTYNGYGAVDNKIMEFVNLEESFGNFMSENHTGGYSGGNQGLEITILKTGKYSISYTCTGENYIGISVNSNQLTTTIFSITVTHRKAVEYSDVDLQCCCSWRGKLYKNDIVRPHTSGTVIGIPQDAVHFTICYE